MRPILPHDFLLSQHIAIYPPANHGITKFDADHANYILSLITTIPARNKEIAEKIEDNGGFVPMSSKAMQSVVHGYRQYLNYFIQTGVIESDYIYIPDSFQSGEAKCYGYRYTTKYREHDCVMGDYTEEFISVLNKAKNRTYRGMGKEYNHLLKWCWPNCYFHIDAVAANAYLRHKRLGQLYDASLLDKKTDKFGQTKLKDPNVQYYYGQLNVFELSIGNMNCEIDDTVHRMHSTVTRVKSEVRNFTYYMEDDLIIQKLVSIDITNSQPYLALVLFNNIKKMLQNKQIFSEPIREKLKQVLPLLGNFSEMSQTEDFKLYSSLVSKTDGTALDLYTYMLNESPTYGMTFANRKEVKKEMLKVFFSSNRHQTPLKKLFSILFPTVDKLFRTIKGIQKNLLACVLQSIESYLVLLVITKRIAGKYPKAPLLTIHDSIATTERYKDEVRQIMEAELTRLVGMPPKLEIELWSPESKSLEWDKYSLIKL